jgi:hypothetical protein
MFSASSKMALAFTVIVGVTASASAQSILGTPMAGSAGAGDSAINGIPFGPANPGVRSDPSGVRSAVRVAAPPAAFHWRADDSAPSVTLAHARLRRMRSASMSLSDRPGPARTEGVVPPRDAGNSCA